MRILCGNGCMICEGLELFDAHHTAMIISGGGGFAVYLRNWEPVLRMLYIHIHLLDQRLGKCTITLTQPGLSASHPRAEDCLHVYVDMTRNNTRPKRTCTALDPLCL